jgi:nucleoside-diphosphate-sugar epimerase
MCLLYECKEISMRVFLTGATGLIGSAIVPELINAGYQVLGLARSETSAKALLSAGAEVLFGNLEDLHTLSDGASWADGVIHCAFDFEHFEKSSETERLAIAAFGTSLAGSDRPLIVSSGLGLAAPTRPITEDVDSPAVSASPRGPEQAARLLREQGINVTVVRVPQVHNAVKQGLITSLIAVARQVGESAYVNEGLNGWPAAHVTDVARLYRLALEKREPSRYHAVAEEGIPLRDIAAAIGRGLRVSVTSISSEEAQARFGRIGGYVGMDLSASSAWTRERLGWISTGPGLMEDLDRMRY